MNLEMAGILTAGVLTLFTPCVLPLIPVYLVMLASSSSAPSETRGLKSRLLLFVATAFFSLGLLLVFVTLGLTATTLGALLTEHRTDLPQRSGREFGFVTVADPHEFFQQATHRIGIGIEPPCVLQESWHVPERLQVLEHEAALQHREGGEVHPQVILGNLPPHLGDAIGDGL